MIDRKRESARTRLLCVGIASVLAAGGGWVPGAAMAQGQQAAVARVFDIPAGSLGSALSAYGVQSGKQLVYAPDLVEGKRANKVSGRYEAGEALRLLLEGTGIGSSALNDSTYVLKREEGGGRTKRQSDGAQGRNTQDSGDEKVTGMPAVMVKGARTLNMDIERTVDDPQPYVIFDRVDIERSGAVSLEDFLKTRLPMNASLGSSSQRGYDWGNTSSVNLRGLGDSQTLILIDGRRLANTSRGDTSGQPDINGIPMGAIERIEILPATASAIYGGSATGGVINIILRRGYQGTEVTLNYDNSFDTDSAIKRIDISSGFSLLGGRTSVLLTGSYSESNALLIKDRSLLRRGYENMYRNNPALYASTTQPIGSGVNIRSATGTNLVMKDGTPLGASFTSAPDGYGGIASDGGAALLANAGTYNFDYGDSAVLYQGGRSAMVPRVLTKYFSGSVSHEFSDDVRGFAEASHSDNTSSALAAFPVSQSGTVSAVTLPASAPTSPFNQDVVVTAPSASLNGPTRTESLYDRFSGGLIFKLPGEWMGAADYTYTRASRSSFSHGLTVNTALLRSAVQSGQLDILADLDGADLSGYVAGIQREWLHPLEVTTKNPAVRISGPLGSLSGGSPTVSMLMERQDTKFGSAIFRSRLQNGNMIESLYPERWRKIDSAYLELRVPFISSLNERAWIKELELQVAGRLDKYSSVNAGTVNAGSQPVYVSNAITEVTPLAAVRFRPGDSLMLRASYSEGFLPPDINQQIAGALTESPGGVIADFADPLRDGVLQRYMLDYIAGGGRPDLQPEYSTSWTLGVIYTPRWLEDLRVSVDYTNLAKEGNIVSLTAQSIVDNEQYFPGRVVRGPRLPTDPQGWAGPVIGIDTSLINAAASKIEAFDLQMDYTLYTADKGSFNLFAVATYQTRYDVRLNPASPYKDSLGVASYTSVPLELKANLGVEWTFSAWTLGWNGRYASSYYVADPLSASAPGAFAAQGNGGRVPSQTYHDAFGKYRFGGGSGGKGIAGDLLSGLELQVGIRNLFNKMPPYDYQSYVGYYSTLGDPRLRTYYVTLRKSF